MNILNRIGILVFSVMLLASCAGTKSEFPENTNLIPPKKSTESLDLNLEPVEFEDITKQKSGICFKDVQDAENYLMNYNILYSYISQQKNIIEYYENSFYK